MSVSVFVCLFDRRPYTDRVLPAYETLLATADPEALVNLLKEAMMAIEWIPIEHGLTSRSTDIYRNDIAVLRREKNYSSNSHEARPAGRTSPEDVRFYVDHFVAPELVEVLCLPHNLGINPRQSMSRPALSEYLYSHSAWIQDYFTFAKEVTGPILEIQFGEWSRFLSRSEIEAFDIELSSVPEPQHRQVLEDGLDNLRSLVHTAQENSRFELLLVSS